MKDNGGPAYPTVPKNHGYEDSYGTGSGAGMTMLDYFAGHALAGLLSDETIERVTPEGYAKSAYDYAQAMIEERNKRNV